MTTYKDWQEEITSAGTVTSVGVNTANGFSGSTTDPTGDARINIQTSVEGILKGNGVAVEEASPEDFIDTNVLSLEGSELTATINGVPSVPIDISDAIDVLNTILTGLSADVGRVVGTDTILEAFGKLSHAPTMTALALSSNGVAIIIGTAPDTVTIDISAASGVNTVKFPGGSVTSTTVIGNNSPASGTALSNITTGGVQQSITVINQLLTGFLAAAGTISATDSLLTAINKLVGNLALKADLAGAAFSGTVTVQTPVNPTQVARKDYVDNAILAAAPAYSNQSASGNISITSPYVLTVQNVDATAMKLPDAATTLLNCTYTIQLTGAAQNATITVPTGQYLNGVLNGTVSIVSSPNYSASFRSNAANYWVQIDNVAALALKANLAGAAFTGEVTVQIAANAGNPTRKDYVDAQISGREPTITTLTAAKGGTGFSSYTIGDFLYANTTTTLAKLAIVAAGSVIVSGTTPSWSNAPSFGGNPTAPNISSGDNSTKLANTNYTDSALLTFNNINGLKLSWASNTTLGLTSGHWNVLGSSVMRTSPAVTINIANSGVVNGLDTGAAANSTNYYVYAIGHGTTPALNGAILSTNSTTPTLPSGYIVYRYIGRVRRDGSGIFIPFIQTGNGTMRTINYNGATSTTQVGTLISANVFTALSLSNFVPPGVRKGVLRFDKATTATNSYFAVRETGSSVAAASAIRGLCTGGVTDSMKLFLPFLCDTSQSVDYVLSISGDLANVYVESYEEEL